MLTRNYGLWVRRIGRNIRGEPSLVVQRLNPFTHEWVDYQIFGEMSDDYAYSNSHKCASGLAVRVGRDGLGELMRGIAA